MTKLRTMRRTVEANGQEFVVTLEADAVTIRPKRARDPEATVSVSWDRIYQNALLSRARGSATRSRRRRVKRGLLGAA